MLFLTFIANSKECFIIPIQKLLLHKDKYILHAFGEEEWKCAAVLQCVLLQFYPMFCITPRGHCGCCIVVFSD
jgi:hypothetical protein